MNLKKEPPRTKEKDHDNARCITTCSNMPESTEG